ncbi:DMT family transporter [Pontivivens ytuae]|uniref:DMT family transporter n=1 Tax=Pontivivens ytuae TaxID=2789856 RepID=A0A7S9LRR9_9RHOB|nr:DMT family transporter [Pontivivens ytuae]QPH53936.1 DMT family transporter [Pontivivens ytuae]
MTTAPATMRRDTLLAWGAVAVTLTIWASYLIVTRAAAAAQLGPVDVGILRFLPAALLFAPIWLRRSPIPPFATWREVVTVALTGGFAFVFLLSWGLQYAPVADSGVFAPSMLPLYVALLSFFVLGERFSRLRVIGFALILAGALGVGGWEALTNAASGSWRGHLLISAAAFLWACYTIAYRRSGIAPLDAAAMICFWSALAFIAMSFVMPLGLTTAPPDVLALQIVMQGVLSGFVSTFTYGYALSKLAPSRVAACAALVPVMAAIGGWLFLGEPVGIVKSIGIAIVATGVLLASGAIAGRAPWMPGRMG